MIYCWYQKYQHPVASERTGECAYSIKLKTVTRLPTGENRWVPSGLNKRLPWQYTVPSKFEN